MKYFLKSTGWNVVACRNFSITTVVMPLDAFDTSAHLQAGADSS
jgi:hypothetical protein